MVAAASVKAAAELGLSLFFPRELLFTAAVVVVVELVVHSVVVAFSSLLQLLSSRQIAKWERERCSSLPRGNFMSASS